MKNQFIYTRTDAEGNQFKDSFNVNKVVRAVTLPAGNVLVVLDDFNEQVQQVPEMNEKSKKVTYKSVRQNVHSEIDLSPEDGVRFYNTLNIEVSVTNILPVNGGSNSTTEPIAKSNHILNTEV